ncbi:TrmH family RNA methyltransferase [Lactococcus sp.]|uniref:TrmH family RNA methyltransferase n=1 Tax=Lactococcus sp. TaxID=44273 RepID=UPI0035B4EDD7
MEMITSKDNKKIKETKKLLTRKGRKQAGNYLIEGFHLFNEALAAKAELVEVFVSSDKTDKLPKGIDFIETSPEVLKNLSETGTPQGIVAVVKNTAPAAFTLNKILILENVQDPGNVGTMIRTADAAGFDAVITTEDTADIYSPKVMRSMQGSNFHLSVLTGQSALDVYSEMKEAGLPLLVTTLSAESSDYKKLSYDRFALVMGNEGNGVSELAVGQSDKLVHIEMPGQAESLNVAVAAGILMFSL